jgi:Tol biopolymer transport system component
MKAKSIRFFQMTGLFSLFLSMNPLSPVLSQDIFGKNKVQYQQLDWKYTQSKHFDVYYYADNEKLAEFTADCAESSYVSLKRDFRFDIRERIPIVVYSGHNAFKQTNVTSELIEESVGGFTEIFKDRVVIPFQGSYKDYRHVVHHELTHAVMFQTFYGGSGMGSMVMGMARFQLPLWLAEGLAEYESLGWDAKSDMFMRDATINNYVPPIEQMYGFMVYKGGQSLFNYIAEKYGSPKVGEILGKIRVARNVDQGLKQAIGIDTEELSKRWHKHLEKTYWPDVQDRVEPSDISKRVTDHEKKRHFLNGAPALSPKGDKLAYISDQSDFSDIYLMSTLDNKNLGRLVQGERSDLFEEMHWTRPGMDWSPDGSRIVFSAKTGGRDALYIFDVANRVVAFSRAFELDGVFSPKWSPDGKRIAFMGIKDNQSDIFVFSLDGKKLDQWTNDIFSDMDPAWSPDGSELAFISDRGDSLSPVHDQFQMNSHQFQQVDLYVLNTVDHSIERLTRDQAEESSPAFGPDGSKIIYLSDKNGISNIYMMDRNKQNISSLTNLLTGASQISMSKDASRLAFSAFYNGGYDIFIITNPLDIEPGTSELRQTVFMDLKKGNEATLQPVTDGKKPGSGNFNDFVFTDSFRKRETEERKPRQSVFLDSSQYKEPSGKYRSHPYKIKFSPDIVMGNAGYSQFWGLEGSTMIQFSDVLGNHQIDLYTDLVYNIQNSNIMANYFYLPKRTDFGFSAFHFSYRYYTYYIDELGYLQEGYLRDRNYGGSLFLSRPFDQYRRIDFSLTGIGIDRTFVGLDPYSLYVYGIEKPRDLASIFKRRLLLMGVGYTTDTAVWGMTAPTNGDRSSLNFTYSPKVDRNNGLGFWTFRGDLRRYIQVTKGYGFGLRLSGGVSGGKSPQRFLLGGMSNWINYQYRDLPQEFFEQDAFYFSSIETPLRGYPYYDKLGTRFALANVEFRFPFVHYLILGFPLPMGFQDIRGAVFMDVGSAWNDDKAFKPFESNPSGGFRLKDLAAGYGFGVRMNLGYFILRYDLAWGTNFASTTHPINYFSLGAEF